MANKRRLKKAIKAACGDLACETILARECVDGIDHDKMNTIVLNIAALQMESIDHVTFSFDQSERNFESRQSYRKARSNYNRQAYRKLITEFNQGMASIVKMMNEALPAEQKEANKAAAKQ